MNRVHLYLLSGALALVGLAFAAWKVLVLDFPLLPYATTDIWRIEVHVTFEATGGPAKVVLQVPAETGDMTIVDQGFSARGYGVTTERGELNRRATFAVRAAKGRQDLYYRVVLDRSRARPLPTDPPVTRASDFTAGEIPAAQNIADAARAQSSDVHSLAAFIVKRITQAHAGDDVSFLIGKEATTSRLATVAVSLLRLAGEHARTVHGLALLPERRNAHFVQWIEVWDGKQWFAMYLSETTRGAQRLLLPWWRGRQPFAKLEGGSTLATELTVDRVYELSAKAAVAQQKAEEGKLVAFSLFGLPLQSQALFRTLLVIPLGVFLLVVLRNVVGFNTFGTFMPVLIALAFRQTGLAAGIVFFVIVLAAGLAVRLYVERLKLLLVPRLAAVLIVVIGLMAGLTIITHRLGLDVGLSVGLFPMVILTMTIERMTVTWEERGAGEALSQAAGSLIVAAACFLIISRKAIEHLFFVFPELLLVLLAVTLLLGRYTGYRLLEVWRFRVLAK